MSLFGGFKGVSDEKIYRYCLDNFTLSEKEVAYDLGVKVEDVVAVLNAHNTSMEKILHNNHAFAKIAIGTAIREIELINELHNDFCIQVNICNDGIGDFNHAIHLLQVPASIQSQIYKEFREHMIYRRNQKDCMLTSEHVHNMTKHNNSILRDLRKTLEKIEQTEEWIRTRTYTPRARKDLWEKYGKDQVGNGVS